MVLGWLIALGVLVAGVLVRVIVLIVAESLLDGATESLSRRPAFVRRRGRAPLVAQSAVLFAMIAAVAIVLAVGIALDGHPGSAEEARWCGALALGLVLVSTLLGRAWWRFADPERD